MESSVSVKKADQTNSLLDEVIDGLNQSPKQLPSKYFYDTAGSQLFDAICELDEYYPYRTEMAMLPAIAQDLSHLLTGDWRVVEFGAGSLVKIRLLLEHLPQLCEFIPIDIASDHLQSACDTLQVEFPDLTINPIAADFTQQVALPNHGNTKTMGFFPGSTIGNFSPADAVQFLQDARQSLGQGALLLIGVDTKKSPDILHNAYNDQAGVTKQFNRNILTHINRQTDADFNVEQFDHYAFYSPEKGRIEMHLVSQQAQQVTLADYQIELAEGETIHTENSYKFTSEEFLALASQAGWRGLRKWYGENQLFSVHLLKAID